MKILLDTHIALWSIADSHKLPSKANELIATKNNEIYYSIASVWEIAIKHYLKPDLMPMSEEDFVDYCRKLDYLPLPINNNHIFNIKTLNRNTDQPKHNDPFDRLILSQAKSENLILLTHDSLLLGYNEPCIMLI